MVGTIRGDVDRVKMKTDKGGTKLKRWLLPRGELQWCDQKRLFGLCGQRWPLHCYEFKLILEWQEGIPRGLGELYFHGSVWLLKEMTISASLAGVQYKGGEPDHGGWGEAKGIEEEEEERF